MKVYISADMEGVTGVTHPEDALRIVAAPFPPANTHFHRRTITQF